MCTNKIFPYVYQWENNTLCSQNTYYLTHKNLNYKLWLLMKRSWKCPQLLNYLSCTLLNYRLEQYPQNWMVQHTSIRERDHQNALVHLQPLEKARTSFSTAGKTRTMQPKHTGGFQFSRIKVMSRISATNEKTQIQSSSWACLPT